MRAPSWPLVASVTPETVRIFLAARQACHVLLDCLLLRSRAGLSTHGMDAPGVGGGDVSQVGERAIVAVGAGVVIEHGDDEILHGSVPPSQLVGFVQPLLGFLQQMGFTVVEPFLACLIGPIEVVRGLMLGGDGSLSTSFVHVKYRTTVAVPCQAVRGGTL